MMGLTSIIGDIVQNERIRETKHMESYGWINTWLNVVANIPDVMAPAATFGVYAIQAMISGTDSLNTVQAFTSLALIKLVSYPSTRLLAAVPNLAASIGCFDRIREFLLAKPRLDKRLCSESSLLVPINGKTSNGETPDLTMPTASENVAIRLENASIRPVPEAENVLKNLIFSVTKGSLVMITGPVGCGKTTLLKAVLGELPCNEGSVYVHSKHIAYCAQSPWLQNGSIRQTICGTEEQTVDETWYKTILEACALTHDISKFLQDDEMVVGSRGISLSGGQQHRVALARALYSRAKIFLLDDILSALDKETENFVVDRLFGDSGILAQLGATVVLVTHATQHLHLAHQVIAISSKGNLLQTASMVPKVGSVIQAVQDEGDCLSQTEQVEKDPSPSNFVTVSKAVAISDEAKDLARQSGDFEIYKYYFRSIGLVDFLIFMFFCFLFAFCSSFSGMLARHSNDVDNLLSFRHMVEVVER